MIHKIHLGSGTKNIDIKQAISRAFFGLVPANGKTYSIKSILENENYYRKVADKIEKVGSKK